MKIPEKAILLVHVFSLTTRLKAHELASVAMPKICLCFQFYAQIAIYLSPARSVSTAVRTLVASVGADFTGSIFRVRRGCGGCLTV
jgi:hypothetical protein